MADEATVKERPDPCAPAYCLDCGLLTSLGALYPTGRCRECEEFYCDSGSVA